MDLTEYLSWRQVAAYLVVLALYVATGILVGQYLYPALGVSSDFLNRVDGRGSLIPFIVSWSLFLFGLGAIPLFRKRFVLTSLAAFAGGTALTIGWLWLTNR